MNLNTNLIFIPKNKISSREDVDFEIFTENCMYLGSTLKPQLTHILKSNNFDEKELLEYIEIKSGELEVCLKFQLEFNCPLSEFKSLQMETDEILDIMDYNYNISEQMVKPLLERFS